MGTFAEGKRTGWTPKQWWYYIIHIVHGNSCMNKKNAWRNKTGARTAGKERWSCGCVGNRDWWRSLSLDCRSRRLYGDDLLVGIPIDFLIIDNWVLDYWSFGGHSNWFLDYNHDDDYAISILWKWKISDDDAVTSNWEIKIVSILMNGGIIGGWLVQSQRDFVIVPDWHWPGRTDVKL